MHSKLTYICLTCCREELRHWLETTAAGLPCNLPQQLQQLTHAASSSSSAHAGKEQGRVTRRDMLALLPARTVNKVNNVWVLSATCCATLWGHSSAWQCSEIAWNVEHLQQGQSDISRVCLTGFLWAALFVLVRPGDRVKLASNVSVATSSWMWTLQFKVYGSTGHTLWTSSSACMHRTCNGTVCTGQDANEQRHAMQMERSIYDAASRAVQHQRNPDGSVKQDAAPAEPVVHDAASTSQPAGVIKLKCMDDHGC